MPVPLQLKCENLRSKDELQEEREARMDKDKELEDLNAELANKTYEPTEEIKGKLVNLEKCQAVIDTSHRNGACKAVLISPGETPPKCQLN